LKVTKQSALVQYAIGPGSRNLDSCRIDTSRSCSISVTKPSIDCTAMCSRP